MGHSNTNFLNQKIVNALRPVSLLKNNEHPTKVALKSLSTICACTDHISVSFNSTIFFRVTQKNRNHNKNQTFTFNHLQSDQVTEFRDDTRRYNIIQNSFRDPKTDF